MYFLLREAQTFHEEFKLRRKLMDEEACVTPIGISSSAHNVFANADPRMILFPAEKKIFSLNPLMTSSRRILLGAKALTSPEPARSKSTGTSQCLVKRIHQKMQAKEKNTDERASG